MASFRLPGFSVRANGFAFANCYPPGSPVVEIPTPFGKVPIGDAHGGLCGGMVFAAMDGYLHGVKELPPTVEPPLFRYFCQRLLDSWDLPFGVLKYYDWQRRRSGLLRMTVAKEWPRIRAQLHRGVPAALGVVQECGYDPRLLVSNHQVLCYGYDFDEATGTLDLAIYDPNYPNDEELSLSIPLRGGEMIRHSCEGPTVRGVFLTRYRRPARSPDALDF